MRTLEAFAWGGAAGYVIAVIQYTVRDVLAARREAAAKRG
jgi:hypothetical protein